MPEIEREGVRLHYEQRGAGPPLLLISPLGWSGAHWGLHQLPAFSAEFEVITFDHRGTGRSSTPEGPYSTRRLARDVVVLLEEIDLLEPIFVLGLSGGGAVAQWLCLDQPEAVRAAVLVASGPGQFDARPVPRALDPEMIAALEADWPASLEAELIGPKYFVEPDSARDEAFLSCFRDEEATALVPYLWHQQAGLEHETTDLLGAIEMPCFVLVGERDEVALADAPNPIEGSLELAKRLFYSEYVEVEQAAHALHIEQPEAFNAAVADFLVRH